MVRASVMVGAGVTSFPFQSLFRTPNFRSRELSTRSADAQTALGYVAPGWRSRTHCEYYHCWVYAICCEASPLPPTLSSSTSVSEKDVARDAGLSTRSRMSRWPSTGPNTGNSAFMPTDTASASYPGRSCGPQACLSSYVVRSIVRFESAPWMRITYDSYVLLTAGTQAFRNNGVRNRDALSGDASPGVVGRGGLYGERELP